MPFNVQDGNKGFRKSFFSFPEQKYWNQEKNDNFDSKVGPLTKSQASLVSCLEPSLETFPEKLSFPSTRKHCYYCVFQVVMALVEGNKEHACIYTKFETATM